MNDLQAKQRRDLPRAIQILCGGAGTWTSFPTFFLWFSKRPRWLQSVAITRFFLWLCSHISHSVPVKYNIFCKFTSVPICLLSYGDDGISIRKFWLGNEKKKKILPFVKDLHILELHVQIGTSDDSTCAVKGIDKWPFCKPAVFLLQQVAGTYINSYFLLGFPV